MVNKLIEYHRHIDEIEECYRKVIKKVNADQPKADVFSQGNYRGITKIEKKFYSVFCKMYRISGNFPDDLTFTSQIIE